MSHAAIDAILQSATAGEMIPYLGPGMLTLSQSESQLPGSPQDLVVRLTAKCSVPHKIRKNLTAAAQFIENFKHRKSVSTAMTEAFRSEAEPTSLHAMLASIPELPLMVHAWYDDLPQKAMRVRSAWSIVQGVSQAEHYGNWVHYYAANGTHRGVEVPPELSHGETLLYQPLGSVWPAQNYLVSDSDFVEVLTEIDIQTPIPEPVQELRKGKSFLFLGCRFTTQLDRIFARQIIKRSSDKHWAVLPEEMTRNEARFVEQYNIERLSMTLAEFESEFAERKSN